MSEERIKRSFKSVKKDLEGIRTALELIGNKNILQRKFEDKIFTSRPFVNQGILEAVKEVLESGWFSNGPKIREFEEKFSKKICVKNSVAVANATVGIEVVLKSLGVKSGDEIIVPSHTTMPTIEPILNLGAKPVFVDINEQTYTIDPLKIKNKITKKTKAVMPVHIYGQSADLGYIKEICEEKKLFLIEDCAQAHDALYKNQHVGTLGDAGVFSFYPTKNLSVLGEGGMIVTNNQDVAEKCKMLINHGESTTERYKHIILGSNYRMSEIHAAIGIKQLENLEYFTKRRREIADLYFSLLDGRNLVLPEEVEYARHVYHLYVIRVHEKKREEIIKRFRERNIFLGIHYPIPCHMQPIVKKLVKKEFYLPITEKVSKEILSLPIYPDLTDNDVEIISEKLKEFV